MPGFDPKAYIAAPDAPAFDPKAYAESPDSRAPDTIDWAGNGKAALERTQDILSLGYRPQIFARSQQYALKLGRLMGGLQQGKSDDDLRAEGFKIVENDPRYVDVRDAEIKRLDQQAKDFPVGNAVGTVLGTVGTAAVPFGAAARAAKGAGLAAKIAQAAKTGAILGAASNPGDVEGEVDPLQLYDRGKNALIGGAIGGATQGLISGGGKLLAKAGQKLGSALTGVSEQEIETYARQGDAVKKMIRESGGDTSVAADKVRENFQKNIQATRQKLNGQITQALEQANPEPIIDAQPILDKLGEVHGRLDPDLHPQARDAIESLADRIGKVADRGDGKVSLAKLQEIKELLQSEARAAYMNKGVFPGGDQLAKAAKGAAAEAKAVLDHVGPPEIRQANAQLQRLHIIEDNINKNILKPGKPEAALIAAGNSNPRGAAALRALGEVTGKDMAGDAQRLAAARTFANPSALPVDSTGKAVGRMLFGTALGTAAAGPVGAAIGGAATSPMALKLAIDSGRIPVKVAQAFINGLPPASQQSFLQVLGREIMGGSPFEPKQEQENPPVLGQNPGEREPAQTAMQRRIQKQKKK